MPRSVPRESLIDAEQIGQELMSGGARGANFKDLSNYRVLVLDVSFQTIDVISWQRAICLEMFEKVDVLEYYDAFAYSAYAAYFIPAVIKVRKYVKQRGHTCSAVSLSRRNVFIRDNFTCQYCGSREHLTIDHVKPASKGGPWTWTNLTTACAPCNTKKGDKSLSQCGMKLMSNPREPSVLHLSRYNRFGSFVNPPNEWRPFIPQEKVRNTRKGPIDLDIM